MNKGITLIEIVLYIALLSAVIGSAIPILMNLNTAMAKQKDLAHAIQTFLFVEAKIKNITRIATAIVSPSAGESSESLVFDTENLGRFTLSNSNSFLLFSHEEDNYLQLVASDTKISNLNFYQPDTPGPQRLVVRFAVNGFNFGTTTFIFRDE